MKNVKEGPGRGDWQIENGGEGGERGRRCFVYQLEL
jgi:hypothetical protein